MGTLGLLRLRQIGRQRSQQGSARRTADNPPVAVARRHRKPPIGMAQRVRAMDRGQPGGHSGLVRRLGQYRRRGKAEAAVRMRHPVGKLDQVAAVLLAGEHGQTRQPCPGKDLERGRRAVGGAVLAQNLAPEHDTAFAMSAARDHGHLVCRCIGRMQRADRHAFALVQPVLDVPPEPKPSGRIIVQQAIVIDADQLKQLIAKDHQRRRGSPWMPAGRTHAKAKRHIGVTRLVDIAHADQRMIDPQCHPLPLLHITPPGPMPTWPASGFGAKISVRWSKGSPIPPASLLCPATA